MATQEGLVCITLVAGADLSAKQFYGVKVNSSGQAVLAALGEMCIGILQNKPASGEPATVAIAGKSKAIFGASTAIGLAVKTDANGKFIAASAGVVNTSDAGAASDPVIGSHVVGVSMGTAGADLAIGEVLLCHMGVVPTTAA